MPPSTTKLSHRQQQQLEDDGFCIISETDGPTTHPSQDIFDINLTALRRTLTKAATNVENLKPSTKLSLALEFEMSRERIEELLTKGEESRETKSYSNTIESTANSRKRARICTPGPAKRPRHPDIAVVIPAPPRKRARLYASPAAYGTPRTDLPPNFRNDVREALNALLDSLPDDDYFSEASDYEYDEDDEGRWIPDPQKAVLRTLKREQEMKEKKDKYWDGRAVKGGRKG
ncbi:hypothetical protein BJ508DRAFT_330830 [Ascobolus immersus RN42]|uniref:Uncharacterized protein n=1 Tax=Ascobolus immersus RN42 TaxID=1160509 RepID=A0A3N4HU08_ASCIM|nr:hypothetical protein BJ508DRAFT_330830 [Ascobolus immersus RN42]